MEQLATMLMESVRGEQCCTLKENIPYSKDKEEEKETYQKWRYTHKAIH